MRSKSHAGFQLLFWIVLISFFASSSIGDQTCWLAKTLQHLSLVPFWSVLLYSAQDRSSVTNPHLGEVMQQPQLYHEQAALQSSAVMVPAADISAIRKLVKHCTISIYLAQLQAN